MKIRFPFGAGDLVRSGIIERPEQWTMSRLFQTPSPTDLEIKPPEAKRMKLDIAPPVQKNSKFNRPPKVRGPDYDAKKLREMRLRAQFDWSIRKEQFGDRHPSKLTRSGTFPPHRSPDYEEQSRKMLLSDSDRGMVFKASPRSGSLDSQHLTIERGGTEVLKVEDLPIEALAITSEKEDLRKSIQIILNKVSYKLPILESIKLDSPQLKQLQIYELQDLESIMKGLQAQLELGQSQQIEIQKRLDDLSRKLEASSQSSQLPHDNGNINHMDGHTATSSPTETHSRMEIIMSKLKQYIMSFDPKFKADPSLMYIDQHQYSITLNAISEILHQDEKRFKENQLELKRSLHINEEEWKAIEETTFWIRSLIPIYKNAQNGLKSKLSHLDSWYRNIQKKAI